MLMGIAIYSPKGSRSEIFLSNYASINVRDALARVPGVGASLARELVRTRARRGPFASWDEVASVPGVGSARLATLRAATELR